MMYSAGPWVWSLGVQPSGISLDNPLGMCVSVCVFGWGRNEDMAATGTRTEDRG